MSRYCYRFFQYESTTLKTRTRRSRNYRLNRNGNFCKGTQVSKIIAGKYFDARAVLLKKSTRFSCMSAIASLLCFGCLAPGQNVNGCFFANIDVFFYWPA